MKKLILTALISAASIMTISSGVYAAPLPETMVRVAIIEDRPSADLLLKSKYVIYALNTGKVLREGTYLNGKITASKDGIIISGKALGAAGIRIKLFKDSNIYVDTRRFRGSIDILRKDNGMLLVVNNIGLDDYLYGVLYHEVSHRWPMECLKAQAIAARTFALQQIRQNRLKSYDLRCDIYSQMYGGRTGEKWSTTKAVDVTRGRVLTFKGNIFPAYYHATCAGHTEDASNLWNIDIAPLKGVPCNFCGHSKHYRWIKEIPLAKVESVLKESGYKTGHIDSVKVLSRNKSGRNGKIDIWGAAAAPAVISAKDFRQMFGPNDIRSTRFDTVIRGDNLVLSGMGWGHGAGMCQWGAFGMSQKGKKCDEILKYYYPGTEITTIDKLPAKQ